MEDSSKSWVYHAVIRKRVESLKSYVGKGLSLTEPEFGNERKSEWRYVSNEVDVCTDVCCQKLSLGAAGAMIILIILFTMDPSCLNLTVRACFERFRLNMDTSAISSVLEVMNAATSLKVFASTAVSTLATDTSEHSQNTDWHQPNNSPLPRTDVDRCPE